MTTEPPSPPMSMQPPPPTLPRALPPPHVAGAAANQPPPPSFQPGIHPYGPAAPRPPAPPIPLASPGWRLLAPLLGIGVAVDLAVRGEIRGLGAFLALTSAALAIAVQRNFTDPRVRMLSGAAAAISLLLIGRASAWLVPLNLAAGLGLLMIAAGVNHGRALHSFTFPQLGLRVLRALAAPAHLGLPYLRDAVRAVVPQSAGFSRQAAQLGRGILFAAPVVLLLGGLLVSADAVFASFFEIELPFWSSVGHLTVVAIGTAVGAGLLADVASPADPTPTKIGFRLGTTEAVAVLGSMVLLYAGFAVAQVIVLFDRDHVLQEAGLTYAEYARTGFFQLLWAAAITLVVLLAVRALTSPSRLLLILSELVVLLTLAVVAVSVQRLMLYEEAFGLTMLRLFSTIFASWLGLVFVLVGLDLPRKGMRGWLVSAIGSSALITLIAINIINPEALVVRRNIERSAQATASIDVRYLVDHLGDDAVPVLADRLDEFEQESQATYVRQQLCESRWTTPTRRSQPGERSFWSWNLGHSAADSARDRICVRAEP